MLQIRVAAGVVFLLLLIVGPAYTIPGLLEPTAPGRVAPAGSPAPPPDTMHADVTAGSSLILSLPAELNDAPVDQYTMLQGPALSGVAGRSFTWITRNVDPGTYDVLLRAQGPAAADTLVVRVGVQPD